MSTELSRTDRLRAEARQAAAKYTNINDACPYPWGTPAAIEFKREFLAARAYIQTGDMLADEQAPEPFCGCAHELKASELETMRCEECGKAVVL